MITESLTKNTAMKEHILYSIKKRFITSPAFLIFFVTNTCNLRCGHCFYSEELNSKTPDLSLSKINAFSSQLGHLLEVDFSGGEPFLREDLFEIYKIFIANNKPSVISIPTNGTQTDNIYSDVKQMLAHGGAKHLTIVLSIDGPAVVHDAIRGDSTYAQVENTYAALAELKKDYAQLHIRTNTVISNKNYACLSELHENLSATMPAVDIHDLEIMRGDPSDASFCAPDTDKLHALRPVCHRIFKHYTQKNHLLRSRIEYRTKVLLFDAYLELLTSKKVPWPCWAGRLHCVIDHNGDVSFCELFSTIGNIRDTSFSDIWNSDTARMMRINIRKKQCTCIHSCFHTVNLTFNHRYWPDLLI